MKNTNNIPDLKINLSRSVALLFYMLLATSFLSSPHKSRTFEDLVTMKVEQENDAVTVSVKTSKDNKVQFYMFNVEGNLIKELSISGSKKISITTLEKGIYLYEFFKNDERLKSGKIELK